MSHGVDFKRGDILIADWFSGIAKVSFIRTLREDWYEVEILEWIDPAPLEDGYHMESGGITQSDGYSLKRMVNPCPMT